MISRGSLVVSIGGIDYGRNWNTGLAGVEVGRNRFTDLEYNDDIVLPVNDHDEVVLCLTQLSFSVGTMGLNVSYKKSKTKIG